MVDALVCNDAGQIGFADGIRPGRSLFGALDLGTNNCRLLIARPAAAGFRVIDAFSRIVRLGEGLTRSDRLSEAAMDRTLAALRVCSNKIRRRGVTTLRAVATEACRRATNCELFLDRVYAETGIDIEIISSTEEGRLAIVGCSPLLVSDLPYALVFDIGGGSTELIWLEVHADRPHERLDQVSIPCGVISLVEHYGGDRLPPAQYRRMVVDVADSLTAFAERNGMREAMDRGLVQALGTSGTVTTLAGVHLGLPRYDRTVVDGSYLRTDHALTVTRHLMGLDIAQRAAFPCIGHDRADLIVAGCAILEAILTVLPIERLRVADRGLREGILTEMMETGQSMAVD